MADSSNNWENLYTFYLHLSPVYVCSSLFTCLALFWTWWSCQKASCENNSDFQDWKPQDKTGKSSSNTNKFYFTSTEKCIASNEDGSDYESEQVAGIDTMGEPSMMKHLKSARQMVIEKKLTAGLTKEQLLKEKETQASQLEAIYRLLKQKEEQFNIRSMDELQEQLKLYKS